MSRRHIVFLALTILWMGLIFWFSSAGHETSSGQSGAIMHTVQQITGWAPPEVLVRKAAHFTLYFVLGVLLILTIRTSSVAATVVWRRAILAAILIAALYAISDELHQTLVGGRSGQVSDVLLDTIAAAVGVVVVWRIATR